MTFKTLLGIALMASAWGAQAACPTTPGRFAANGAEVADGQTGLVWARCSVGQSWSGSACTGTASSHTHEQALALAKAATGWRLPNVKELASLADKGCQSPSIDSAAFPNTSSSWYWTSSPSVGDASYAWVVNFHDGNNVFGSVRGDSSEVRLVRASQ